MRDQLPLLLCSKGVSPMSFTAEIEDRMRFVVREAAMPVTAGETIKAQMNRAWASLGRPKFWRVRAAWNGEAGCWSARACREFESRYEAFKAKGKRAADGEARKLAAVYTALATRLEATDAEFHRSDIAALLDLARRLGDPAAR